MIRSRIAALRQVMKNCGLEAYIIPSSDPHQSEYVAEYWQFRSWLSGFTGSAGTLVVTQDKAGLWTDARYYLRAKKSLEDSEIQLFITTIAKTPTYEIWLRQVLKPNAVVGFDGCVLSYAEAEKLERTLQGQNISINGNLDLAQTIWTERPLIPSGKIGDYPVHFAGESRTQKLSRVRRAMAEKKVSLHFLATLDDIAWTLNLRGSDVPNTPVFLSYALIGETQVWLFIQGSMDLALTTQLEQEGIILKPYKELEAFLKNLSSHTIYLDPQKISYTLRELLSRQNTLCEDTNLAFWMKAQKNPIEICGHRQAQVRDGVAMVRWWRWLDQALAHQTEISAAERLDEFRRQGEYFQSPSFTTIVGYAANSAIGHYKAYPETTPTLKPEGILLVDSGGQYLDGTTDITRTISLGKVTNQQKLVFTTVLKSLIKLSTLEFPEGTLGDHLDAIAREPLWRQGWDCRHGIGHGVGHFLSVHEGPQRFSKNNQIIFQPGMITSCEPGVYFEGEFGVRLENLLLTHCSQATPFGDFYGFETLTLFPFDLTLVDETLLSNLERQWLNDYHAGVFQVLRPLLNPDERYWLAQKTQAI